MTIETIGMAVVILMTWVMRAHQRSKRSKS